MLKQCSNIFKHNDQEWRKCGPPQLINSVVACFLNKIGARNAVSLKAMYLVADCCDVAIYQFQLLSILLERGLLRLRMIGVFVKSKLISKGGHIRFDMSELNDSVGKMTRAAQEKELQSFCRTLTTLVRGCPSLEEFDYRGDGFNAVPDLEASMEYLGELFQVLRKRKAKKAPHLGRSHEEEQDRL